VWYLFEEIGQVGAEFNYFPSSHVHCMLFLLIFHGTYLYCTSNTFSITSLILLVVPRGISPMKISILLPVPGAVLAECIGNKTYCHLE